MSTFGLDNAGSGFNIEDDEDLESMLGRAASASEDDGELTPLNQGDAPDFDELSVEVPAAPNAPQVTEFSDLTDAPVEAYDVDPAPVEEEFGQEPAPVAVVPEPTPEPEPVPAVVEPEPAAVPAPPVPPTPARARVHVPSEAEQVEDTARVIRILDVYRQLSNEEKAVALQFVTDGALSKAEDAVLVVKVLNADPMLAATMRALREAYECEAVERAFYAMALDTKTLHSLGSLVSVFSGQDYDESLPNLAYSRAVVAAIAGLGEREISFVKATESVLAAAENDTV